MSAESKLNEVIAALEGSIASTRCKELIGQLEGLGFEVRDGKSVGHKLIFHSGIPGFHSASFNCGHGKNPEVKRVYVRKLVRLLKQHDNELIEHIKQGD
ncbi:MAG: hypothetical protein V3U84_01995 [Thiotrichaceae bacterium]